MESIKKQKNFIKTTIREFVNEQFNNIDNMKQLIIQSLNDAFILLERQVPQTKKKTKSISIENVKPSELTSYMESNGIPNDAYFSSIDSGYGSWDDIVLSWEVDIPTTDKDKLSYKRKRFTNVAWKSVYDSLNKSGYKRVGYNTSLLKQFDDTTVYDMYMNKDFDRLVKYYSLPFVKESWGNLNQNLNNMNKDNKNTELNNTDKKLHISDVSRSFTIKDLKKAFQDGRKYTTDAFNEEHWDFDYENFKSWYDENYDYQRTIKP